MQRHERHPCLTSLAACPRALPPTVPGGASADVGAAGIYSKTTPGTCARQVLDLIGVLLKRVHPQSFARKPPTQGLGASFYKEL